MACQNIFDRLWQEYARDNHQVWPIHQLLQAHGEKNIVNDHVALRTFDDPRVNIQQLAQPFIDEGYRCGGEYTFVQKKLYAQHFEHPTDSNAPLVFISELKTGEFSDQLSRHVDQMLNQNWPDILREGPLVLAGRPWTEMSYQVYQDLLSESEYAAWLYAFGFRANHFTVLINALSHFDEVSDVNALLLDEGFGMNQAGGLVKGTPQDYLEQSSTLASKVVVEFMEGGYEIPCCYYEFAKRYPLENGQLYRGFVTQSADRIFESTDSSTSR